MTKIKLPYIHEFVDRETGKVFRYVRRGRMRVPLHGLPGSPEFMQNYQDALAGQPVIRKTHRVGSVGDLIMRYYGSPEFRNLKPSSQKRYRLVLGRFGEQDGTRAVADLPLEKARKVIEEIGATKPGMANLTRSVLLGLFEYAINIGMRQEREGNPFKRIKPYKGGTHHTWTNAELDAFRARWPLGTRERLAFAVLLYTAQRVSDAVNLKRSDILNITQKKTGTELNIPIHPALARAIKAGPANGIYLLGNPQGQPTTGNALGKLIERAVKDAGMPRRCVAHGLRKANQRLLAEYKATFKQMQSVSGHKSSRESERYSAAANQALLAVSAIALLPDEE